MKIIVQTLIIILLFLISAYVITYPYELSYTGDDEIVLYEESYDCDSIEEIFNRAELKGKKLYVRVYEPFEGDVAPYTQKEVVQAKAIIDSIKDKENYSNSYNFYSMVANRHILKSFNTYEWESKFYELSKLHHNDSVKFIFLAHSDVDSHKKEDCIRKWKQYLKSKRPHGSHYIMNPELSKRIRKRIEKETSNKWFPAYMLVNSKGEIVHWRAPWPTLDKNLLFTNKN
jgi:hypothetical protein